MQGVSDASEKPGFFRQMADTNLVGIARVYQGAEALFAKLQVCRATQKTCLNCFVMLRCISSGICKCLLLCEAGEVPAFCSAL